MNKDCYEPIKFYGKNDLALKPVLPGAEMWSVSLDKVMLTYFELDANCLFKTHHHESEQIIHVLCGVIYFVINGRTVSVAAGEVIAIPANIPHAAFTKEEPARAVDAWSPVMKMYKGKQV